MKNALKQLFIFSIGLISACTNNSTNEKRTVTEQEDEITNEIEVTQAQYEAGKMNMITPKLVSFYEHIKTTGIVDVPPQYKASISTFYAGYVSNLKLLEGQYVRKGTVLFLLQNPEFIEMQQAYLEAKEQLAYLQNNYERQEQLANENIASKKNFLKAKSEFGVTNTRYKALQKKLMLIGINTSTLSSSNLRTNIEILAPIAGYITEIEISPGKILNPNDVALKIVNTEHLHAEIMVFEQDITKVKEGQRIDYTFVGHANRASGNVHLVSHVVSEGKSVVNVHGHIDRMKELEGLYPGMFVEAKITTKTQQLLGIPETCVVDLNGKSYILVKQKNTKKGYILRKREVVIAKKTDGFLYVEGVKAEDLILQNGVYDLAM